MYPFKSAGLLFIVAAMLVVAGTIQAQPYMRLNCRHISTVSGLSGNYVREVLQDPYGFMWIATEDGLNRYDGKNVIVYNKGLPGRYGLTGSDIWDIALDTVNQLLWAISSYGGIDAIDIRTGNIVYSYAQMQAKTTSNLRFTSLCLSGGKLYIGSTDGIFTADISGKQPKKISLANPFADSGSALAVDKLIANDSGYLWAFCREQGVLLIKEKDLSLAAFLPEKELRLTGQPHIRFYNGIIQNSGSLLIATSTGLRRFSGSSAGRIVPDNDPFPHLPLTNNHDIYACREDSRGDIWFCSTHCLARISAGTNELTLAREQTSFDTWRWLDAAFDIYFDRENNLWLGCQQGLIFAQNKPSCFTALSRSAVSDVQIRHAYYLGPVNDTMVYSCAQDGLFEVNPVSATIIPLSTGKPFYHAFKDPYGKLIVSSIDGSFILSGRSLSPLTSAYPEFIPFNKLIFNGHCYFGDSVVVFGTENDRGVIVWNYRKRTVAAIDRSSPGLHLKENTVNTIHRDSRDHLWVLGDNSVSILDPGSGKMHSLNTWDTSQNKSHSIFFDICGVGNRYYLASYGSGVLVLDSALHFIRTISTKDGLSSNSIYKLLPYRDSILFVTSNNGISVVDLLHNYQIRKYYAGDGLHSDNFEENSGAILHDRIYAGGAGGITMIIPALMSVAAPAPALCLRQISIETRRGLTDSQNVRLAAIDIPDDALQTTVFLSAFNYLNPERFTLAYRIKELKGGWIDIGNRDFINFIGQNPGTYTLEVRTAGADGVPSESPLELTLNFLPKWYQTLWFKAAILLSVILLFYLLYRYRIQQLQQQQKIRRDIASDLHDDLGSTLNSVKIYSHLARREQEKDTHLERIEDSITQAALSLRDLIWVLDEQQDTVRELIDRIKKFALPLAQASHIRFESHIGDEVDDRQLSKTAKRNLLLIFKEAVNNSVKYAECSAIKLQVTQSRGKLSFSIQDDGKGFDMAATEYGHGLRNIRERAGQIRYCPEIISAPGKGALILLVEK